MLWMLIGAISLALLYTVFAPLRKPYSFDETVFGDVSHKEIYQSSDDEDPLAPARPSSEITQKEEKKGGASSLGIALFFFSATAHALPPSSQPATKTTATSKPASPNKQAASPQQLTLLIHEQGTLHFRNSALSLSELVRLSFQWKQQKPSPKLHLKIHPRAPYGDIRTIQSVLRGAGIAFSEETIALPKTPPQNTQTPHQKPQPTPPPPAKQEEVKDPSQFPWEKVAIATEADLKAPANLEIRGQLVDSSGTPLASVATGLTRYEGSKRSPLARQRSNAQGLFRYAIQQRSKENVRIAVLAPSGYLEFPVPLQNASQGVLYIQLPIQTKAAKPPTKQAPHARKPPHKTTKAPTKSPQTRYENIKPAKILATSAPNDSSWLQVTLGRAEDAPKTGGLELRGRVMLANGSPAGDMPTGLLLRQASGRHKPIGRARTDKKGRFRYLIREDRTRKYDIVILYANRLHLQALPTPQGNQKIANFEVSLELKALHKLLAEGISIVVERLTSKVLRVTHFVSLLYHQTDANNEVALFLPLPANNAKVQLDKQVARFKPTVLPRGIQFKAQMNPGRNRFAYSYLLPIEAGRSPLGLKLPFPSERVALFFDPKLQLATKQATKIVKLGNPGQQRDFQMLQMPPLKQANQSIAVVLLDPSYVPQSRLMAWLRDWKNDPNKRNKLFGLSALLLLSFLGIFFLIASPSPKSQAN